MPVLKHHFFTHISGGMKNLFGLVEPSFRPKVHVLGLDEPLVDLYEFLRPRIAMNVMDATYVAQSVRASGPYYGPTEAKSVSRPNLILASADAVALDAVAADISQVEPADVEMVRIAAERGLGDIGPQTIGNARTASLKIKKAPLTRLLPYAEEAWTSEWLNRVSHPLVKRLYGDEVISLKQARREMDEADPSRIRLAGPCSKCGLCAGACPVKNIELNGQPVFGPKCIKCFICVEICPDGALAIERK
jgi:ferredoxin